MQGLLLLAYRWILIWIKHMTGMLVFCVVNLRGSHVLMPIHAHAWSDVCIEPFCVMRWFNLLFLWIIMSIFRESTLVITSIIFWCRKKCRSDSSNEVHSYFFSFSNFISGKMAWWAIISSRDGFLSRLENKVRGQVGSNSIYLI